jgi:hypothetical protein
VEDSGGGSVESDVASPGVPRMSLTWASGKCHRQQDGAKTGRRVILPSAKFLRVPKR